MEIVMDIRSRADALEEALHSMDANMETDHSPDDADLWQYIEEVGDMLRQRLREVSDTIAERDEAERKSWIDDRYVGVL